MTITGIFTFTTAHNVVIRKGGMVMYLEKIRSLIGDCNISIREHTRYSNRLKLSIVYVIVTIDNTGTYDGEYLIQDISTGNKREYKAYVRGSQITKDNIDDLLKEMFKG